MNDFKVGVVITVAPGRSENVELTLKYLSELEYLPAQVVLVADGPDVEPLVWPRLPFPVNTVRLAHRHQPGREQPRNIGVRALREFDGVTHAWFLDSDILVAPSALTAYREAWMVWPDAILIGPYEWLSAGQREPDWNLRSDFRWEMFDAEAHAPKVAKLNVALGCFGGNLVWPINRFRCVGGFHPQLHHGRCEDGELGLRAASARIPMVLIPEARGWHVAHPIDQPLACARNERDVPLINQWHPWVEGKGLIVTDQDGARFDFVCECGEQMNTLLMWDHLARHSRGVTDNGVELILPEGL